MNFKSTSLLIFLFIIFFSKNLFADPFSQFEKSVNLSGKSIVFRKSVGGGGSPKKIFEISKSFF